MRFSDPREMKKTKIEIIPMIDTMFFLLVFFILASLNIIDLRGLNLDLPPAGPPPKGVPPRDVKLEIQIDKDGNKVINDKVPVKQGVSASKELTKSIIEQLGHPATAEEMADITVTITPDEATWHEYVIQAVDDARGAKIQKFAVH